MKRFLSLLIIVTLMFATVVLFSGQPPQNNDNKQNKKSAYQTQSENDFRPKKLDKGYYSEVMYTKETYAVWPKNYSTVYIRPYGYGTVRRFSVITHRPKMIIYQGNLPHRGVKFTTLFPVVHFIYIANPGDSGAMQIIYQPQAESQKLSQYDRVHLATLYAKEADRQHYERVEKILEKRKKDKEERDRKFEEQNKKKTNQ